jgi:DNA (cytosine-5)-methyltransferase 1
MTQLRVLDLFSGIGGFSLGLKRAGMKTVAFCEIEEFPRRVLKKHWPEVPCYDDIRTLTAARLAADGIGVDVICGGFPCQDISNAGQRAGLEGERSGLWSEYARLIGELRPQFVIVENVAALLGRGLSRVLGDLAEIGYDAEWHCIPASHVGAPHRRDRIWIIAYADTQHGKRWPESQLTVRNSREARVEFGWSRDDVADTVNTGLPRARSESQHESEVVKFGDCNTKERRGHMADSCGEGLERQWTFAGRISAELNNACNDSGWRIEPNVGRVANGVPSRVDRLKGLGNAVVPAIPELIGRAIIASMQT